MTNKLRTRVYQHKNNLNKGFTSKYKCKKLVYCEHFFDVKDAIAREKQIKGWLRHKKIELIESVNPNWDEINVD